MAIVGDIRVQQEAFDTAAEVAKLRDADVGAIVTFSGICRDEDGTLAALTLEHYPGMAEAEMRRIAEAAAQRWPVTGLTIVHRYGRMEPGDDIVLVVAASRHRGAAFQAAEFVMDFLKTNAPFWKKEERVDGTDAGWVEAATRDDDATARWKSDGTP